MAPDLVVIFGFRTVLSIIGLSTLFVGYWIMEKRWDEQGSSAYEKAQENATNSDYKAVDDQSKPTHGNDVEARSMSAPEKVVNNDDDKRNSTHLTVPKEDLEAALPLPKVLLAGFGMWAFSFLFHPDGGFKMYASPWNICGIILVGLLGGLTAFPLRKAAIECDLDLKKKAVSAFLLISIWLGIVCVSDEETDAPWYFCTLGGKISASLPGTSVISLTLFGKQFFSSFCPTTFFGDLGEWALHGTGRASPIRILPYTVWAF
jgi:hypothetical protein